MSRAGSPADGLPPLHTLPVRRDASTQRSLHMTPWGGAIGRAQLANMFPLPAVVQAHG